MPRPRPTPSRPEEPPSLAAVQRRVRGLADAEQARVLQRFFKTGPGDYGEGDRFLGIKVPVIRGLVRDLRGLPDETVSGLLESPYHEERLLGLLVLVAEFEKGDDARREAIYRFYLSRTRAINNWDLVDVTAEHIVGGWLRRRNRAPLRRLARSKNLWERRIAIVATMHFIRRYDFGDTLEIAQMLLDDREDLIHKATGWMLREVGKRDMGALEDFLRIHYLRMPRTMLRYAIERFPEPLRQAYLKGKVPSA